jgi:hypothetical protein
MKCHSAFLQNFFFFLKKETEHGIPNKREHNPFGFPLAPNYWKNVPFDFILQDNREASIRSKCLSMNSILPEQEREETQIIPFHSTGLKIDTEHIYECAYIYVANGIVTHTFLFLIENGNVMSMLRNE